MNAGRALWDARWFRAVVVFSVTMAASVLVVPALVRQAAEREDARGLLVWMGPTDPLITPVAAASPADVYWVQVGVFRDADAAARVAQRLRERKYRVQESVVPGARPAGATAVPSAAPVQGSGSRYEVIVSGGTTGELAAKVTAKGLAGRPSTEGVVITPSLPLSEAVALSRELGDDGLAVRVRRVGSTASPPAPGSEREAASGTDTLHRVRVGGFADRATAMAALREIEALGYKPFLARGSE
jgi:hypothetical protein